MIFCEEIGGKERGITEEERKVYRLARKRYLTKEILQTEKVCKELLHLTEVLKELKSDNNLIEAVPTAFYSDKALHWLEQDTKPNTMAPEDLKYETKNGIKVRSKSERTIADRLAYYQLPFKYEAPVFICGRNLYPDFTVMRAGGNMVLWEHFGLMDKADYAARALQKIIDYQKCGYATHTNLICTWEKDIESPKKIDDIIERFLL